MFTIHEIKNSSFVYVKHVFLDISIKGQFESNNIYYSSNQKLLLLFKKSFSLHFYKKRISKKILKVCNHYSDKDNPKTLSYFLVEPLHNLWVIKEKDYYYLSLKCNISAIWLVETACIFLIFLIATEQISMKCEIQES